MIFNSNYYPYTQEQFEKVQKENTFPINQKGICPHVALPTEESGES